MKYVIYRNLDRPFTLLGIKGRYIAVAGAGLVSCITVGLICGAIAGTFAGLAVTLILSVVGYLSIAELQQRYPEKALSRKLAALGIPKFITVRTKIWKR
jgi:hypothetical protein